MSGHDLWIFGYGSLMWRPGFEFIDRSPAAMHGYGRSFCIYSVYHRGTGDRPGLVLGLDRGGACEGMAYRVAADRVPATVDYLREREQVTGAYREMRRTVRLLDGRHLEVEALCYVVERAHPQYTGPLALEHQAAIIRGAIGHSGPNAEYLINTVAHLRELGLRDRTLERLAAMVGGRLGRPHPASAPGGIAAHRLKRPHGASSNVLVLAPMSRALQSRFLHRRTMAGHP